jgi:predicted RNA-binding Zn ribbon-like protein
MGRIRADAAGGTGPNRHAHGFPRLLGARLCLHFANTVESPRDHPEEFLHDYRDLVRWSRHASVLSEMEARALADRVEQKPEEAASVFARALKLRAAIDDVFRTIARSQAPPAAALGTLENFHREALAASELVRDGQRYRWSWRGQADLRSVLWPVVESAIEVLTAGDLTRVKECPGADDCGWLFYDTSRNRSRRWCSMEGCGSRVKMRRYYARSRSV